MKRETLFCDLMQRPHLLIAGATGSGKSCLVDGLLWTVTAWTPDEASLVLIDPKRTELVRWSDMPHCSKYASEPKEMISALRFAVSEMERRFAIMQRNRKREYPGKHLFVVVDELADLMTTHKKDVFPLLQRLAQLGRAARVHLWACTQCPLREIIPTPLKCNFADRVALRTASKQDSRNILDRSGAELLPDPKTSGKALGIVQSPMGCETWVIPYINDSFIDNYISRRRRGEAV